jgi:hypothetical protein
VQIKVSVDLKVGHFFPGAGAGNQHKRVEIRRVFTVNPAA